MNNRQRYSRIESCMNNDGYSGRGSAGNIIPGNNRRDNGENLNTGTREQLWRRIHEMSFVKCELELYLDTHPTCPTALDYYTKTVEELERLTLEYESKYGPITAKGTQGGDSWTWVEERWPWHRQDDKFNGMEG